MRQLNNVTNLLNSDEENVMFSINDIDLHVPPTAISIHKEGLEYSWKTLRSKVSTKIASGNGSFHVQVSVIFPADSLILLHRLISEVRNNPFVSIRNALISQSLSVTHKIVSQLNFFTLFGLTVSNHPSSPGAFVAELDLRYFNYKPFGNSLLFKKDFVYKSLDGNKLNHYVHQVFPEKYVVNKQPLLKKTVVQNNVKKSLRTNSLEESLWKTYEPNKIMSSGITISPRSSSAYKRYGNFLQLKYLKENFGITFYIKTVSNIEDAPNRIGVSSKIYDLLQGKGDKTIGLHELRIDGSIDSELVTLRRELIHAMLLSGINTRIVAKEFVSLKLDGNFLFRYRKHLNQGTKGLNEEEKRRKIKENKKAIFDFFSSGKIIKSGSEEEDQEFHQPRIASTNRINLIARMDEDALIEDPSNKDQDFHWLAFSSTTYKDHEFYPISRNVSIEKISKDHFYVYNKDKKFPAAIPIVASFEGTVSYPTENSIILTDLEGEKTFHYFNTTLLESSSGGGVSSLGLKRFHLNTVVTKGSIIGFMDPIEHSVEIKTSPMLMDRMLFELDNIMFNHESFKVLKKQRKSKRKYKNKKFNLFNEEDRKYIDSIRELTENEYSSYTYRSGLENVYQKARILAFDSNFSERDVELITGIKVSLEDESIPKFEQDVTNVSCSLRNIISSIPILGHEYPTHQFLGSIEPSYQFNFIGKSSTDGMTGKIKELENVRANASYMAKNFPQIPDSGNIIVESFITKLVGSFKLSDVDETIINTNGENKIIIRDSKPRFIISSLDTFTIEGSPGAIGLNLRFSESKPYDEEEMKEAKTSGIEEDYLERYASIVKESGMTFSPASSGSNQIGRARHSYTTAKYIPYYWTTKYFGAQAWYSKAKYHLRKKLKKQARENTIDKKIDKNSYLFCKNFLDPLQDFLTVYSEYRNTGKKYNIQIFSTLDKHNVAGSRTTFSNHFAGVAVDFRIRGMNAMEACAILELLEKNKFFNDVFKNRSRCLGIGIYGSSANISNDMTGITLANLNSSTKMDGSQSSGFIHLDANFKITETNLNSGNFGHHAYRRRWIGKEGADAFRMDLALNIKENKKLFWNNSKGIKSVMLAINDTFNIAYQGYLDGSEELDDEEIDENDSESHDDDEGEIASNSGGSTGYTREVERPEDYKMTSTKPEDFITFLEKSKNKIGITDSDIQSLYKTERVMWNGVSSKVTKYNFFILDGSNYEITFIPKPGETELSSKQKEVINKIKLYYSNNLHVNISEKDLSTYKKVKKYVTTKNKKYGRNYEWKDAIANERKRISISKSQLNAATALKDAKSKQLIGSNDMLKSFTELASVILIEPYLYVDTEEDFIKEMQHIQKELYNFSVLPSYYNIIEKFFTGNCTIEQNLTEITGSSRNWGGAVASGLLMAGSAIVSGGATLKVQLLAEAGAMIYALWNSLSGDAQLQLNRVKFGIEQSAKRFSRIPSFIEYKKYYVDNEEAIFGKNLSVSEDIKPTIGDFLEEMGNANTVASGITNYTKEIYSKLKVFKHFNKIAQKLDATSTAKQLIKRSIKDSKSIISSDGEIDANLANFALAEEITVGELRRYLIFLYHFPAHIDEYAIGSATEEDAEHIYKLREDSSSRKYVAYRTEASFGQISASSSMLFRDTNVLDNDKEDYFTFLNTDGRKIFGSKYKELSNVDNFNYLITHQYKESFDKSVVERTGAFNYFRGERKRKELKRQQMIRLAYLKNLLKAILEENMELNPELVEESRDPVLLRALDGSTVFELLEENAYPDIDLPQDPRNPYSNSNLSPCFYYHDQNDHADVLLKKRKDKEFNAAKKIVDSSIEFQKGLRKGIFTGDPRKLSIKDSEEASIVEKISDSTEILRTVSDFIISPRNEDDTVNGVPVMKIGLYQGDTNDTNSNPAVPVTSSSNLTNEQITAMQAQVEDQLKTARLAFKETQSMFGSNLGYKASELFKKQIVETKDESLARTIGIDSTQKYETNDLIDLCEDSSKNISKLRSMKEAFPTFRLYIIEEDEIYTDRLTAFDDFFYYNSVISFTTHNSRELAASSATIQLQNISGILDGTRKRSLRDIDLDPSVEEKNLREEGNYIDSIVLRPGVTVQLRAGYDSNTNELDVLISGKITDINYAQNNTICNITVQSFGAELTALRKGNSASAKENVFYSTHQLLGSMMLSDELKHFGRSKVGAVFQTGEFKDFSLDLDLYKKESSFNFSLSRGFFDWIRENTFALGVGVGVLTAGLPALRLLKNTKLVSNATSYFAKKAWVTKTYRVGGKIASKLSWVNPFGISKLAQKTIINRARMLSDTVARYPTSTPLKMQLSGLAPTINTFDEAVEYLIKAQGLNIPGSTPAAITNVLGKIGGIDKLLAGGIRSQSQMMYGRVNGAVVAAFKWIANRMSGGRIGQAATGEELLKHIVMKHKGFTSLGLGGIAPTKLSKAAVGGSILMNIVMGAGASIRLPLSIGATGLGIATLLGGLDLVIDSVKYAWENLLGSFSADKNKLKKKKLLSPQDDNIFAPHPNQYMTNIPNTSNYFSSLADGLSLFGENIFYNSTEILNTSTFGLINLNMNEDLKNLNLNPFKLIDKRLDVAKYENPFILTGQTIWQVLHECTLRHPGYIYGTRPYGNSLEYRVFFGVPNQRYWSKKISNNEIRKLNKIYNELSSLKSSENLSVDKIKLIFPNLYANYISNYPALNPAGRRVDVENFFTAKAFEYYLKKTKDRFVPFRQFHLASSDRNIISNNIVISSHNMINAVSVNFINNMKAKLSGKTEGEKDINSDLNPSLAKYGETMEILRFRANNNIGMDKLKEKTVTYRNIVGPSNAIRYGLGELLYGTRKMYEGSLTLLGDTKINPWDVVLVHDNVTNMFGPVEVCSVTHMFSFETGFITDVEVNALVTANEELTHPVVSQNIIHETRARIFEDYNSLYELGNTIDQRKAAVSEIISEEIQEMIEEKLSERAGLSRKYLGAGASIDFNNITAEKKKEWVDTLTKSVMEKYIENENVPNFLNDIIPPDAKIPKELTDILGDAGTLGATGSAIALGGEALRRRIARSNGLSIFGGGLWKAGLFFAGSIALANSGETVNRVLSTSFNSGDLGKNLFRQQILSRMDNGNLIQLYPLVKDGLPLVTGGFEEVDESEKWNNMLGYIYNTASNSYKGYLERQQELKAYGKNVITAYDNDELNSMTSRITINMAKGAKFLGFKEDTVNGILGYIYKDD